MAERSTARFADRAGRHRIEPEQQYEDEADGPGVHRAPPDTRRRLWLVAVGGPALGILLCATAFMFGPGAVPAPDNALPAPLPAPVTTQSALEEPSLPAVIPSTLPMPEQTSPSARPSVTTSPTQVATTPTSPSPALLGPSNRNGVENLVQRYCDRHTGGSADTRDDGRWQCRRLLSSSTVDMNVACQDTYGSGALARNPSPGDPYAWRCYR